MNGYDCTYGTSMQTRHVCLCMHVCMNVCMYAYVISHVCRLLFLEEQTIIKIHFGFGIDSVAKVLAAQAKRPEFKSPGSM